MKQPALVLILALRAVAAGVDSIGMTVSDLDRSVDFYTGVLGFEKLSERELDGECEEHLRGVFGARLRVARLRLGSEVIELTEYLAPRGRPVPADTRSNDAWFQHIAIVVPDMDRAYQHLRKHKVQHASTGPQRLPDWNANAGGIKAFYFRDPDGHHLEIIWFPAGRGDPTWQAPTGRLFAGIDHTAIVVSDTERSLAFYRDQLGLRVAGASENWGPEQERLNNVFGARLRITGLRGDSGPGIELLEYLAPQTGRTYPADSASNDLWHWQTRINKAKPPARARFISPGAIDGQSLIRDPDGHALLLSEN
jgi:catechol 2,3-dioxygenase-like lactoylglutathione lyase family enzyme